MNIPDKQPPFTKAMLNTSLITLSGLLLGIVCKLLDLYTTNLGNIFSQISVFICLCTVLALYSRTPFRAALHVFLFSAGMVATYYLTADLTESIYSTVFLYGWMVFACLTPLMAFVTWYAAERGILAKGITGCILLALFGAACLLFDGIRISDLVFAALTLLAIAKKRKLRSLSTTQEVTG